MNKNNFSIIMAGGVGSRFWPMSRTSRPKQFIDILGTGETLIQQTFRRLTAICPPENIFVVTHTMYYDQVLEQLSGIIPDHILCEPIRRNTAPCIAYAAHKINKINPNANIIVTPSDHIIIKENVFTQTLNNALQAASNNDWLLTLGITPSRPDTGYGYIQFDDTKVFPPDNQVRKVKTFTEKPQYDLAVTFLQSGDFLWNAGIFISSLKSLLKAFNTHLPEIDSLFHDGHEIYYTTEEKEYIEKAYTVCRSISMDYGIMEKADNVFVIAADMGWSDLGTWGSLYENSEKDDNGNVFPINKAITSDTRNCIIALPNERIAVIQGLEDYIIVDDNNVLLICKRSEEQQIKEFVEKVKTEKGEKFI